MNFNYSYRAFLITSMLFGIMFLAFQSVKLSTYEEFIEENTDIEYNLDDLIVEEEELKDEALRDVKVETNRAFNEAEKFISQVENERENETEDTEGRTEKARSSDASQLTTGTNGYLAQNKKASENKETFSNGSNEKKTVSEIRSSKRNSTVSYRLVDRSSLDLPNPVYICDARGKVVINIIVSDTGRVLKATYNATSSTTTNECLIDSALEYAENAMFSTSSTKPKQLGTITYNFPGQQ
jgi:hypothetical protein